MAATRRYQIGERKLGAVELSAYVLDALRADAERALGTTVTRCVITVPAYFDDAQRHATRQASRCGFVSKTSSAMPRRAPCSTIPCSWATLRTTSSPPR